MLKFQKYYTDFFDKPYSGRIEIFFKGWYLILLCKVILLGSLFEDLYWFAQATNQIHFPFTLVQNHLMVSISLVLVLLVGLFARRNYFLSILIFLLYFGYYQIIHPIVNGSDLVLSFFLFLGIFCNNPRVKSNWLGPLQMAIVNSCVLIGQLQIAFMYLTSGWDKLISVEWRNGAAMFNLLNIDFYAVPWLKETLGNADSTILIAVSWLVIIFELVFPVLVWYNQARYYLLLAGVFFHLFIGLFLSLPDFALTMMWCYILFMKDEHLAKFFPLNFSR